MRIGRKKGAEHSLNDGGKKLRSPAKQGFLIIVRFQLIRFFAFRIAPLRKARKVYLEENNNEDDCVSAPDD